MNRGGQTMRILVALLLAGALLVPATALGCSGDDDQSEPATTQSAAVGGEGAGDAGATTTSAAVIDQLSSFKSKDPFIPQAQATTTTSTTPPPSVTTTVTTPTTIPPTTTTAPHRLQVTAIPGGAGTVSFTLDGNNLSGFGAGPALFTGPWGSIQILAINDSVAPFTATFRLNGSIDFTLQVNQYRTW